MNDLLTPCPILTDLRNANRQYRQLLRRIHRNLRHCATCQRGDHCPGRNVIADALREASRQFVEELKSHDPKR